MPIIDISNDPEALTMTVIAEFPVSPQRLWDAYMDPRQIEKFWGPEVFPAKFVRHDCYPGGLTQYVMTGPDNMESRGYWEWLELDAPNSFAVLDGFALPDGSPNPDMPAMRITFTFEAIDGGTRMTNTSYFDSLEALKTTLEMGVVEGVRSAMSQIDAVLADLQSFAHGAGTATTFLADNKVRVSRVVRGSVAEVWRAHQEPELLRRWQTGPDGWSMPVCEVATDVGDTYRYEWEDDAGENRFGFTGELLEVAAPHRSVTNESMIGSEGVAVRNELTLTELATGTLMSLVMAFPSEALRDEILATGMADGMEQSYARLETVLA